MINNKNIFKLTTFIEVLFVLLAGSIGYVVGSASSSNNSTSSGNQPKVSEKLAKEVEDLKSLYDDKINEKAVSYKELESQKETISKLVNDLETTKNDANALKKYKDEYQNLESKMKILVDEIIVLNGKKNGVSTKSSKNYSLKNGSNNKTNSKKINDLEKNNPIEKRTTLVSDLPKKESFSNIIVSNVKSTALNIIKDKAVETNLANKSKEIKVTFTLDENPTAKPEEKTYYIQIINSKNNVIGKHITEFFDDESLTYSIATKAKYNNTKLEISENLSCTTFEKGTYNIFIFDRNVMVGSSTFTLK